MVCIFLAKLFQVLKKKYYFSAKILFVLQKCEIIMVLSSVSCFHYCDSYIRLFSIVPCTVYTCRSFSILEAIAKSFCYLSFRAIKSDIVCCWYSWKSDNYMGSNIEKKPWSKMENRYKKWSKKSKSENFCNRKVKRAITLSLEKSLILLLQYWKDWYLK